MSISAVLSRPYPSLQSIRERLILCAGISFFVAIFLLVFRPFGLTKVPPLEILGYGLITFLALVLNFFVLPFVFPRHFREESWTVRKELSSSLMTIFFIGSGNFLYTTWLGYFRFDLLTFLYFQLITLAVGVFPVSLMILLRQNRSMKKYIREAAEISRTLHYEEQPDSGRTGDTVQETISLRSEDGKTLLEFTADNFLFASAADNYVEIFLKAGEKVSSQLVRLTMAKLAEQVAHRKELYRCHRSYIVNLSKISEVRGNSQGLRLVFGDFNREIPVARGKTQEIRELLS